MLLALTSNVRVHSTARRRISMGNLSDLEDSEHDLETFFVDSWAEHLRQHERSTGADRVVTQRVQSYTRGEPVVRHLVYAAANGKD